MKKIIISVIAVLIIASGITCFIFYSKDKKPDDSHNKGIVNEKVDIKDNEVFSEDSETNKDKVKEQYIDKSYFLEYAERRFTESIVAFTYIFDALGSNTVSTEWLTRIEAKDSVFPWMNYKIFAKKK